MIQKFFAWGIYQVMKVYEPKISPRKKALLSGLTGKVLELGPGTGPNLKYYQPGVEWHGVEPNPHMHPYLLAEAEKHGMRVELLAASALELPYPDASMEHVVGTLVLCSVPDPEQVMREIKRVLKPGGSYVFIEHVAAKRGSFHALVQKTFKPLWCCCADGCHVDRRSWETIAQAEFGKTEIEHFNLRFPIVTPHIMGTAER